MDLGLQKNVHYDLNVPGEAMGLVSREYLYYHYGCDGVDDRVRKISSH
jgi:hypothetical protein